MSTFSILLIAHNHLHQNYLLSYLSSFLTHTYSPYPYPIYRGALWTAGRNAPGSFALFGGSAFVKEWIFGLEDYSKATFFQNFCASIGGSVASITVAAPLDVVKTRIQNRNFDNPEGGVSIIKKMIRNEGFGAFFKGLLPKILVVGPKLVFSFTVAQQLIPLFHHKFEEMGVTHVGNTVKTA